MDSSTSRTLTGEERERALAAARSLGYELQVVQATAALAARQLAVSVTITNGGVAPFIDSDGRVYLLYSVAGEAGIGIAELKPKP